jgi:hypothetical protein
VGTTFKIYLPRVEGAAAALPEQRPIPVRQGSETVLLVEYEEALRELLPETLEANAYSLPATVWRPCKSRTPTPGPSM